MNITLHIGPDMSENYLPEGVTEMKLQYRAIKDFREVLKVLEEIFQEEINEYYDEVFTHAHNIGYDEGYKDGSDYGYSEGYALGYDDGYSAV